MAGKGREGMELRLCVNRDDPPERGQRVSGPWLWSEYAVEDDDDYGSGGGGGGAAGIGGGAISGGSSSGGATAAAAHAAWRAQNGPPPGAHGGHATIKVFYIFVAPLPIAP